MDYEQPALLFLRGAFVRALAVPEPLVALPAEPKEKVSRFNRFTGSQWPQTTTLPCWHYATTFDTVPLALATHIYTDAIDCRGVFCSLSCAKGYISRNYSCEERWGMNEMLMYLYKKMKTLEFRVG